MNRDQENLCTCNHMQICCVVYLKGLNWKHLAERKVPPPFVPKISHELDVGNFATEFTNMAPQDSPAAVPMNVEKMFKVIQNVFSVLLQLD